MSTKYEVQTSVHEHLVPGQDYTVISLRPIWAWALIFGGKDVENRAWSTAQRGRVLIHASNHAMSLREGQQRRAEVSFLSGIPSSELPAVFPRNAILGSIEIVDCVQDAPSKWAIAGRYHWLVREAKPLPSPLLDVEGSPEFWRFRYQDQKRERVARGRDQLRERALQARAVRVRRATR